MIPPLRILDKIRRQQGISRTTVFELLGTRETMYCRLIGKQAGKASQSRIEAYACLLRFTEREIATIVEYNNRYNLFVEHRRKTRDDNEFATLLANLHSVWKKITPEDRKELHLRLMQVTLKYVDPMPVSFIAALNDCNNSTRSK